MPQLPVPSRRRPRHRLARVVAWIAAGLLAALCAVAVGLRIAAPGIARRAIVSSVRKQCPRCTIAVGPIQLGLLRGRASAQDVRFASDPGPRTRVSFSARSLELEASVWSAVFGPLRVHRVALHGATVEIDDDVHRPPGHYDPTPALLGVAPARVERVDVDGGTIVYTNRGPNGRRAALDIRDVNGRIGAFGTRPGLAPRYTPITASARLEGSGRTTLDAQIDPLSRAGDGSIELAMRDQSIAAFDRFIGPAMSLHAHGTIDHARASLVLRDGDAHGQLRGAYHGLTIETDPTSHHDVATPVLTRLVGGLEVRPDVGDDTVAALHGARGARQPYFEFLWNTVRDASERIVERAPLREVQQAAQARAATTPAPTRGGGPGVPRAGHHGFLGIHFGHRAR